MSHSLTKERLIKLRSRLKRRELTENEIKTYKYIKAKLLVFSGMKCINCGSIKELQLDHVEPVFNDPTKTFDINNMQILCKACNRKKGISTDNWDCRSPEEIEGFILYASENMDMKRISKMPFMNKIKERYPKKKQRKKRSAIKIKRKAKKMVIEKSNKIDNWKPSRRSREYDKLMRTDNAETNHQKNQVNLLKGIL